MGNSFSQEDERRQRSSSRRDEGAASSQHAAAATGAGSVAAVAPGIATRRDVGTTLVSKESAHGTTQRPSAQSNTPISTQSSGTPQLTRPSSTSTNSSASSSSTWAAATQSSNDISAGRANRPGGVPRRKSMLLLDENTEDDLEIRKLRLSNELKPLSRAGSGEEIDLQANGAAVEEGPVFEQNIEWRQGGHKVYVTGSFTGWRRMIKLNWDEANNVFRVIVKLPVGTHRMRFVVDGEMKCSDFLPTATDSMGNLVNYIEVGMNRVQPPPPPGGTGAVNIGAGSAQAAAGATTATSAPASAAYVAGGPPGAGAVPGGEGGAAAAVAGGGLGGGEGAAVFDDSLDDERYERYYDDGEAIRQPEYQYGNEIPPVFSDPEVIDKFASSDFVAPPQLPPHLESVILNSNSMEKDNNSVLPIPNHVVLNHLATTAIKHNVLAVASISRYSRKYVAQILYAPL